MYLRSTLATLAAALALSLSCGDHTRPQAPATSRPTTDARGDAGLEVATEAADSRDDDEASDGTSSGLTMLALSALSPSSATRGQTVTMEVTGTGLVAGIRLFVDGAAVTASHLSDMQLRAQIPAEMTSDAGFHAVWVEADGARGRQRSSPVYFTVPVPRGWPEVIDFKPDNGMPGDRIRIVGFNLTADKVEISDSAGHRVGGGVIGTISATETLRETVEFTIPPDWQSGPVAISNSVGRFRAKAFNVGRNLALLPGAKVTASSEYGGEWTTARGADNDLQTSWFTAAGDCVSADPAKCKTVPWLMISFPTPQTVARIAIRGNREYTSGYDFLHTRLELLGEGGAVLWSAMYPLPEPDRDLDIVLAAPVANGSALRFTSLRDESEDPGLSELEVFGP